LNRGLRGSRQISSKSKIKFRVSNFARVGGHRPLQWNSVPEFRRCEAALTAYGFVMKNSNFGIVPLATEVAATARRAAARSAPEAIIEKLLQKPEIAFVDARSVTHGCYTFRIQRL